MPILKAERKTLGGLLDFLVNSYLLHNGVVLLQLHTGSGIFTVLGSDVTGSAWQTRILVFGAFHNYLNPVAFLSHGF